jgi:tetratricopeptide (TPR) repeat protein
MNTSNNHIYLHVLIVIGFVLAMAGCSLSPIHPEDGAWSCDTQADDAIKNGNWQLAERLHRQVLASDPSNCLAIYHLGYILGNLHDRNQEVAEYERAIACGYNQDDKLYFNLGMAYGDLGDTDRAIDALERAALINPENSENHFGLGYVAHMIGKTALAERALSKAIDRSARHLDARILLARIYLDQGRLADAKEQIIAVRKIEPDNEQAQLLWNTYQDRKMTSYD